MPYKNRERKRQWEQEHREQRNAQRRMRRLQAEARVMLRGPAPGPISAQKPKSGWKGIIGVAVWLGIVLLAVFSGINVPAPSSRGGVA
jgi:ferric-dicitrate binding protein FerR (iron transport regulator)